MSLAERCGADTVIASRAQGGVLHLAVSRSTAMRLGPVVAALEDLGRPQTLLEFPPRTSIASVRAPSAAIGAAVEAQLLRDRPACVLVAGDGAATVAASLAAARCDVPIARLGAGLRCGDRSLEAEINRVALDQLADRLFVDGLPAAANLKAEGIDPERVQRAGSTLPDSVARCFPSELARSSRERLDEYVLVTLHKPENVRDAGRRGRVAESLSALALRSRVVLCLHPETSRERERFDASGVEVVGPLAYPDFLRLQAGAAAVVTDSPGVQEETTVLGVACFTLGQSSERTLTLTHGTNVLLGDDPADIAGIPLGGWTEALDPIPLWDGDAGRRIAEDLVEWSGP
jgi:UDP-N-acetylglucosamine 2-epimerase (non-hydrolysing)